MKVNVVKRKAASNRALSRVSYELSDIKYLKELLYEVMILEMSSQTQTYTVQKAWNILRTGSRMDLFRVYFNGEEYTKLDDELKIREENELVIIKLVMMAGRLW